MPDTKDPPPAMILGTELLHSAVLPIELKNGNTGQSKHYGQSAGQRRRIEKILRQLGHVREPFDVPVVVHVTRILGSGQRLWDSSSILRGNYKQLEDALVACGWFVDDSPTYIRHTWSFQDASKRQWGPQVKIEVWGL